ncbi:MAG: hypothetical protein EPO65_04035 [Dehalococcoidia bacterium]|nr:MAG: hypothetical protein EPO65_04035 [Dehalococcoidia bacterium]
MQSLITVGQIALRLQVPLHRVEYAIRAHNIAPIGRAGNARVFSEETVAQLEKLLRLSNTPAAKE